VLPIRRTKNYGSLTPIAARFVRLKAVKRTNPALSSELSSQTDRGDCAASPPFPTTSLSVAQGHCRIPMNNWCTPELRQRLTRFCHLLIDQHRARKIVEPYESRSGYWFGGGNLLYEDRRDIYLVGRYRNAGDSRTGIASGERGLELAIFASRDGAQSFQKQFSWNKEALATSEHRVLSIEGSCLRRTSDGVELYVSTEKEGLGYPDELADHLKPGAGVWSIDVLRAPTIEQLPDAEVRPFLTGTDPKHLHVKDPFLWPDQREEHVGFCSHPYCWSCSNTGRVSLHGGTRHVPDYGAIRRGDTWDVAMTRGTCVLEVPQIVSRSSLPIHLLFYCGGECVRSHDEHRNSVRRPRGHSCEELGGVIAYPGDNLQLAFRLSDLQPLFISPWCTGCSRYVDVVQTSDSFLATWQQSQQDGSQPLVINLVAHQDLEKHFG